MSYEVIDYRPELDPQIVRLQTHLWSRDQTRNAAYLKWKYADNPFLDETLIYLALSGGDVVGMRGMFGSLWQADEDAALHLLPCADDVVVAPEHRNRGVMNRLMKVSVDDVARRGFRFSVSLSAGPITFVSSVAAGWRSPGPYQPVWRVSRLPRSLEQLRALVGTRVYGRAAAALRTLLARTAFDHLDRAARRHSGPVSLHRDARPEAMAELIARLPWDGRIRHIRDARYFAWRFRNPLHVYRFLFWDDGGLQGYLVLQRYQSLWADPQQVNIADWEATDDRVRAGLLAAALSWGRVTRIQAWTASVGESSRTMLRDQGFAPEPGDVRTQNQGALVCRLGDAPAAERWGLGSRDLLNSADWDLRMLYSMAA